MIDQILAEREKTHGPYARHAKITQSLKATIWGAAISAAMPGCYLLRKPKLLT